MIIKTLAWAALGSIAIPVVAAAEELRFSYSSSASSGGNLGYIGLAGNFSFDLSSDPVPLSYTLASYPFPGLGIEDTGYFALPTANWSGNIPNPGVITFYSTTPPEDLYFNYPYSFADGGFSLILNDYVTAPQFYSGTEDAPHFSTGQYTIYFGDPSGGDPAGDASVTITAVPEPMTWAMMLIGMGVTGFALRRRVALKVSYA